MQQHPRTHSTSLGVETMSSSTVTPSRRIRHDARDSLAVMVFSGLTSCLVAVLLGLLVRLGN